LFLQSSLLGSNPFAVLTAIVAPAILTNASSVLALGTSNRLGRVVDRTRVVYSDLAATVPGSQEHIDWAAQLAALRARAQMLLRALRLFYAALGLFAASALVSVGGSIATFYGKRLLFEVAAGLAFVTGASAVVGLAVGCSLMVHETRLAVQSLAAEAEIRVRPAQPSQSNSRG
jgi:branched-subunit amino acid transport protein